LPAPTPRNGWSRTILAVRSHRNTLGTIDPSWGNVTLCSLDENAETAPHCEHRRIEPATMLKASTTPAAVCLGAGTVAPARLPAETRSTTVATPAPTAPSQTERVMRRVISPTDRTRPSMHNRRHNPRPTIAPNAANGAVSNRV